MSATAFKNAVQRREHYERSQPSGRAKLGLLEKHKDYVKRARNFHEKEKRITSLKRKAEGRNPDEFYFKMNNTSTKVSSARGGRGAVRLAGHSQSHPDPPQHL
jgi:U3 small nucleolar RNA-associated protein 11